MTKDWIDYCSTVTQVVNNNSSYIDVEDIKWSDEFYECPQYYDFCQEWC